MNQYFLPSSLADLATCISQYGVDSPAVTLLGWKRREIEPEYSQTDKYTQEPLSSYRPVETLPQENDISHVECLCVSDFKQQHKEHLLTKREPPSWLHAEPYYIAATNHAPCLVSIPPLLQDRYLRPLLRKVLGEWKKTQEIDVKRFVRSVALGQPLSHFPRRFRWGWANRIQIIRDIGISQSPYLPDQYGVIRSLKRIRGSHGLDIIDSEMNTGVAVQKEIPTLMLGLLDSGNPEVRKYGRILAQSYQSFFALLAYGVDSNKQMSSHWRYWDRGDRHVQSNPESTELLLDCCSLALEIRPTLLRRARLLVERWGIPVCARSERQAWMHKDVPLLHKYAIILGESARRHRRENIRSKLENISCHIKKPLCDLIEELGHVYADVLPELSLDQQNETALVWKCVFEQSLPVLELDPEKYMQRLAQLEYQNPSVLRSEFGRMIAAGLPEKIWKTSESLLAFYALSRHPDDPLVSTSIVPSDLALYSSRYSEVQSLQIWQEGSHLCLRRIAEQPEHNSRRSLIAQVKSLNDAVWIRYGTESSARELRLGSRLLIKSCHFTVEDASGFLSIHPISRPQWASRFGRDGYGLYADFEIEKVRQRMRWIPPGHFQQGEGSEKRSAVLSRGYWLADSPCTQSLWQVVMGENPSYFEGSNHPVESVNWYDVEMFMKRIRTLLPDFLADFPTESQWEYACRAGTSSVYYWGNRYAKEIMQTYVWYDKNADENYWTRPHTQKSGTQAVKGKKPNTWGLFGMSGNVWEWCRDFYKEYPIEFPVDYECIDGGDLRVIRGGSWINTAKDCRSTIRIRRRPDNCVEDMGFRLFLHQVSQLEMEHEEEIKHSRIVEQ